MRVSDSSSDDFVPDPIRSDEPDGDVDGFQDDAGASDDEAGVSDMDAFLNMMGEDSDDKAHVNAADVVEEDLVALGLREESTSRGGRKRARRYARRLALKRAKDAAPHPNLVDAVMQDDNAQSKGATIETLGADVEDCGINLQRDLRKRIKTGHREKQGKTAWDSMRNDMTDISKLPSVALVIICCHLFMVRWMALGQDTAVKYFSKFCFTFSWTRAQNGAGAGADAGAGAGAGGCRIIKYSYLKIRINKLLGSLGLGLGYHLCRSRAGYRLRYSCASISSAAL